MAEEKNLIEILKSFNRKERFHLIGKMVGNKDFTLSKSFKKKLKNTFGLIIPSKGVFSAMDYHLDWVYASLKECYEQRPIYNNKKKIITATQEDVDFIICYSDGKIYHMVLLEAKLDTGWTNKQVNSKINRIKKIFGENGDKWKNVKPYFVLLSPDESQRLNVKWPKWLKNDEKISWLELKIPYATRQAIRCDKKGEKTNKGKYWKVFK